ncbi:kininogen-1-like [Mus pahari]|uniref:kininogen-1-like n=1 Tax=Mus pahari TaxID=10093 RepID=UPI0011146F65|nr:kininogen-1-like [Mus pahari]
MKLITILLFCSGLLLSLTQGEEAQEIDCNDETVFQAVDAALKQFNPGSKSGNQYMLYQVIEGTKTDGLPTFYSFKYRIKEGNCSAQSGLAWQDCDFKDAEEAATGECTATVEKRENEFFVVTQSCKITPAKGPILEDYMPCLGCMHPISTDSPDLEPVLKHAMEHFNNNTDHSHLFALRKVKSAHRQDDGECRGNLIMDINNKVANFSQSCTLYSGHDLVEPLSKICAGCPKDIPVDSPQLKEPLGHSIAQLNAENNHTFYFKIESVTKATSQVVAGTNYDIEFIARETKCSKESNTELREDCEIKHLGQSLYCNANVYMRPWENKVFPTVKCQALEMTGMMRRPPGFSPFRTVRIQETKEGTTDSDFIEGVAATIPPYDTEVHDDLIPDIQVQPDSLSFKLISDFPEATSHKCPGRPWKPVSWKDPNIEITELSDFDLLDALS